MISMTTYNGTNDNLSLVYANLENKVVVKIYVGTMTGKIRIKQA